MSIGATLGIISLSVMLFVFIYNNLLELVKLMITSAIFWQVVGFLLTVGYMTSLLFKYLEFIK